MRAALAALPRLRAQAKSRMTSRCTVMRKTGDQLPQNETTGRIDDEWAAVYVDLPFRLAGAHAGASPSRAVGVAGVEQQLGAREGHMPHDTTDLADGDLIEITSGENAGLVLRIIESTWQDQATARRVPVIGADRPEEWS